MDTQTSYDALADPGFPRECQLLRPNLLLLPANEVWGKVICFRPVYHSVHRSRGAWSEGVPCPGGSGPSGAEGLVPGRVPGPGGEAVPGGESPGGLLLRAVRILLECILVL